MLISLDDEANVDRPTGQIDGVLADLRSLLTSEHPGILEAAFEEIAVVSSAAEAIDGDVDVSDVGWDGLELAVEQIADEVRFDVRFRGRKLESFVEGRGEEDASGDRERLQGVLIA